MRPLKLVIKGFGTYLEEQVLDFTLLKDRNIFVITGDTGAGKTTVFDALNYALYGDASGKEREGISFRSDFATPEEETMVELWFALMDKEYYVRREPSYMEKKIRGEGEKEHKPYAELKLPDGKIITGIQPVTKEIEKLLGINKDQFRQIVMIPQGEFKKLLTADSQDREKIFRKIFGTEVFEKIQQKVNAQANELDKEVKLKRNERDVKLRDFDCKETDEEFFRILQSGSINLNEVLTRAEEVIQKDQEIIKEIKKEMTKIEETIEVLNKEIVQGENINKKFEDRKACENSLKLLEEQLKSYQDKKAALDKARKALTVKGFEDKWELKRDTYNHHKKTLDTVKEERVKLKGQYENGLKVLEEQKGKETERKQLEKALNEAEKLKEKAEKYDAGKQRAAALQKEADTLKLVHQSLIEGIEKNEAAVKETELVFARITEAEKEKLQLENQLKEIKVQNEELTSLKEILESYKKQKLEHQALEEKLKAFDQSFKELKNKYETAEESFRRGQAGILAQGLAEGAPCPVCGSKHHPSPAQLAGSSVSEEAVDAAKAAYEKARTTREEYFNKLTALHSNLKLILSDTIKPLTKKLLNKEIEAALKPIYDEVKALMLQNDTQVSEKKKSLETLTQLISQKESLMSSKEAFTKTIMESKEQLKEKAERLTAKQADLSAAKEQLKMIEEEFEGKVKTYAELMEETSKMQAALQHLTKAYQTAEENHTKDAKALGEVDGKLISLSNTLETAQKEKDEAAEVFKDKTLALGFADFKEYKVFAMPEADIEVLDKEIQQFDASLEAARKLYEKACEEVKDLQPADLEIIKEKLSAASIQKSKTVKEEQILFTRIQNNQKVLKEVKALSEKIQDKEQKYLTVGDLAKVMKGDNEYKISFERYVLAAYFDDIVEASNVRFGKMTGGRFELLRKTQKGDARSQQGLDLEVMDNYTGKARSVETLSGGESFKASLAMALGLADVVQSYAGGIQLDTMFVDEGFGTLDPESLESAIACLVGLQQSGRLVGIISHVPELKERIDARLEVTRIQRGSRAEFKL